MHDDQSVNPAHLYECISTEAKFKPFNLNNEVFPSIKEAINYYTKQCREHNLEGSYLVRRINDWTDRAYFTIIGHKISANDTNNEDVEITIYKVDETSTDEQLIKELEQIFNKPVFEVISSHVLSLKFKNIHLTDKTPIREFSKNHRAVAVFTKL